MRTSLLAASLFVATTLAGAPALTDPPASATQADALVTPTEAMRVLRDYERANARNNRRLGVEGQGAIEVPPIQLIDDATFRERRNRGASLGPQGRVVERRVFVPRQTAYPLQFLSSELLTFGGDASSRQLLLFTKPAATGSWKVSTAAQLDAVSEPQILTDRDGWAVLLDLDHAARLPLAPEQLAPALAAIWARAEEESAPSSELFEPGPHTSDAVSTFVGELAATGIDGVVELDFAPAPYPITSYRLERERALVLFTVAARETIQPNADDERLVQPESRGVFGGLVVPGSYAHVDYERLELLAAVVPRATGSTRVRVIGSYSGVVSATTGG